MHEYLHVILEAAIHTAKILPFLFIVYYIIELIEFKWAVKIQNNKLLKGKASPVIGSLLGCVPQCGFSVVSTDLYTKKAISIGALIAVYIATSDEAIPIMIANPTQIPWMLALIGVKIVLGIVVGYLSVWLYKVIFKSKDAKHIEVDTKEHKEHSNKKHNHNEQEEHDRHHDEESEHNEEILENGCCHHHVSSKSFDWLHPLLHCIKIGLFILVINIAFEIVTHIWVGEENLIRFLNASKFAQPLLAILIGLIPNCASSVALSQLFVMGGLSFGALVAGLSVNAGLGFVMLLRQNKNWKENLFIFLMLVIPSLILGYSLLFI